MTLVHHPSPSFPQPELPNFNLKDLESTSLHNILTPMISALKHEIENTWFSLECCGDSNEETDAIRELLKEAAITQMHLEFVLAFHQSTDQEQIQGVREKFNEISGKYENLKEKEDLTVVPAKYVSVVMRNVIINEFRKAMAKCFKKNFYGDIRLRSSAENIAWVQVLTCRFKLFDQYYPPCVTLPRDDLFCFEKSSEVWQDLYKNVVLKNSISEEEVRESFGTLTSRVNIIRILMQNHKEYNDYSYFKTAFSHLRDILYYTLQPAKAEALALMHLVDPKVEEAFKPWKVIEHPLVCKYMSLRFPSIGHDEVIHVPRMFPQITEEVILQEYQDKSINKVCPVDSSQFVAQDVSGNKSQILKELFTEGKNKIPVRVLGPDNLNLKGEGSGIFNWLAQKTFGTKKTEIQPTQSQEEHAIVIHMHGGGFVAMNSNTQKVYLTRWVKNLKLVHFSIDYRLAPESMYPDALDDVWQAYLWITNYAKTVLGIENQKIILTGDSAGGTLALTLTLRLIRAGLKPPHGVLLIYPALAVNENTFSPSYTLSFNDNMLPISIVKLIAQTYVGKEFNSSADPFLSPVIASDELLAKMPPIRIISGSEDPLNDDNWRLLAKLKKLQRDVKFILYENLPHGYLNHQDLKDFDVFVKESSDVIQELIDIEA